MGDRLWLKQSGGPVVATARAGLVRFLELNNATSIAQLERRYAKRILADASFFADHFEARYASLIHLTHVRPCDAFSIEKKDRLAWVVLRQPLSALPPRSDPPLA